MISELPNYIKFLRYRAYKLNPYLVDDLVQEALLRAIKSAHTFDGKNLKAWLARIITNAYFDYKRKKSREVLDNYLIEIATDQKQLTPNTYILTAIAKIPDDFAVVIQRALIDKQEYKQIAQELGIPVETVMSRLHRGRIKLNKMLEE